jgi:hypothetical protein
MTFNIKYTYFDGATLHLYHLEETIEATSEQEAVDKVIADAAEDGLDDTIKIETITRVQ